MKIEVRQLDEVTQDQSIKGERGVLRQGWEWEPPLTITKGKERVKWRWSVKVKKGQECQGAIVCNNVY